MESRSYDFKMFINTLWNDNDNVDDYDYDFLRFKNILALKIYLG
jgi:hypothetical protein